MCPLSIALLSIRAVFSGTNFVELLQNRATAGSESMAERVMRMTRSRVRFPSAAKACGSSGKTSGPELRRHQCTIDCLIGLHHLDCRGFEPHRSEPCVRFVAQLVEHRICLVNKLRQSRFSNRLEKSNHACFPFLFRHYDRPRVIQARGSTENTQTHIILSKIAET